MGRASASRPGKQLKALLRLAQGGTDEQAALDASVSSRTVERWRRDPAFRTELDMMLERQRNRIETKLTVLANDSAAVLQQALKDPNVGTQLDAAKAVLGTYTKVIQRYEKQQAIVLPTGPLLSFPPGTQIALVSQPVDMPQLSLPIETVATVIEEGDAHA